MMATEDPSSQQAAPPPMPERPDLHGDDVKARVDSLSPPDEEVDFYVDGLKDFAQWLDDDEKRYSFKKNNGFSVLIRNPKVGGIMAKIVDDMFPDEMKVLQSAYILCKAAARDYKDNAVRSLQIRGVLDNVFEMIATEKRVPDEVRIEGIGHAIAVLSDPNVCKLMCNKYDLSDTELFDSNYGDFGRNQVRANLHRLLKTGGSQPVQREAYRLVEAIAACPRFYVRVMDQNDEAKLDTLAKAAVEGLERGSCEPLSFGAYCRAVYRLCQHTRLRAALMRQPGLLGAAHDAIENLLDEVSPEGAEALGQLFSCLSMLVLDLPQPSPQVLEQCRVMAETANRILASNRAAATRRWARAAVTALETVQLRERPADLFDACKRLFLEHYDGLFNKTDEFAPTPQVIARPSHLLEMFNGTDWFDAPPLFFAGAFQCLGESVAKDKDSELYKKYKERGGFDMMVRHRSLPRILKTPLEEMRNERYVLMGIWALGLSIMPDNRDTEIRYIQMPGVIDHAVSMLHSQPNSYPGAMRVLALRVLNFVCAKQDICRMVCNKHDFPEFMMKLFAIEVTTEEADTIEELQYQLFKKLAQCPKLLYRLNEESHFEDVISGLEKLISEGWSRPVMFRRLLDCACQLVGNARLKLRPWHRPSMMEAAQTAVGMMLTMAEGVPDDDAAVNLIRLVDLLLKRQRDEELLGSLRFVAEAEHLPEKCRAKAKESVSNITFNDPVGDEQ